MFPHTHTQGFTESPNFAPERIKDLWERESGWLKNGSSREVYSRGALFFRFSRTQSQIDNRKEIASRNFKPSSSRSPRYLLHESRAFQIFTLGENIPVVLRFAIPLPRVIDICSL